MQNKSLIIQMITPWGSWSVISGLDISFPHATDEKTPVKIKTIFIEKHTATIYFSY